MTNTRVLRVVVTLLGATIMMPAMAEEHVSPSATDEAALTQMQAHGNLMETLKANAAFSRFVDLVERAGLVHLLDGNGPYTVFAPTNEAFERLTPDEQSRLSKGDRATLKRFVEHHIVSAWLTRKQAAFAPRVQALVQQLKMDSNADHYRVSGQQVIQSDIPATNGLLNVIDGVLMPHFPQPNK